MTKRALPEQYRLARNIDEGYEIRTTCKVHDRKEWVRVTDVLHILAPVKVSSFTVEPVEEPGCLDGNRMSAHPEDEVFSRRPAVGRG